MDVLIFIGVILFLFVTKLAYVMSTTEAERRRDHQDSHGIKVHL